MRAQCLRTCFMPKRRFSRARDVDSQAHSMGVSLVDGSSMKMRSFILKFQVPPPYPLLLCIVLQRSRCSLAPRRCRAC